MAKTKNNPAVDEPQEVLLNQVSQQTPDVSQTTVSASNPENEAAPVEQPAAIQTEERNIAEIEEVSHDAEYLTPGEGKETLPETRDALGDLDPEELEAAGFVRVPYKKRIIMRSQCWFKKDGLEDETIEVDSIPDRANNLDVYVHAISKDYIPTFQQPDGSEKELWSAYDLLYTPRWKEITARYVGGFIGTDIGIVRLYVPPKSSSSRLYKSTRAAEEPSMYLTMYLLDETFSEEFKNQNRAAKEREAELHRRMENKEIGYKEFKKELVKLQKGYSVVYPIDACYAAGGELASTISAFEYAWNLNGQRPFAIVEQLVDYREHGRRRQIVSKFSPHTELREEFNIFDRSVYPDYPESIFTNFRTQAYICDKSEGNFIVKKYR